MIYAVVAVVMIIAVLTIRRKKSSDKTASQTASQTENETEKTIQVSPIEEMPVIVMQDGTRTEGTVKMTQGLQVYDANGNIILDVTDRLTRIIDTFDVTGTARDMVTTNKTYTLPSAKHNLWIHMVDMDTSASGHVDYTMSRTDDVTVSVQIASGRKTKIIVGVY